MNRKNIFRVLWSRRFSTLGALIALGLLFNAAGAKAGGCAVPYKAGAGAVPVIPFVSPHADGEWDEHATIVGLWHVNLTANYDENFPSRRALSHHPIPVP